MSGEETHISFETLVALLDGNLPASQAAMVQSHLATCSRCAGDLEWIRQTTALMSSDDLVDAPVGVVARALRAFQVAEQPVRFVPSAGPMERLVALLQFDSGHMTPAAGLRSGQEDVRQMLYSTDLVDIDLRITAAGELWVVSGQLLGECESGTVRLGGDTVSVEAEVDEYCEFHLSPVRSGEYLLTVRFNDVEVTVPHLRIGEARGTP
jgi:hypothetical protein